MSGPSDRARQATLEQAEQMMGYEDDSLAALYADELLAKAHDPALGPDRSVCLRDVVQALRHIDTLDEVPTGRIGMPQYNPLWDAAAFLERKFCES